MVEWWAWVLVVIAILIFLIDGFFSSRRFERGEYGWYRSGWDGANAKAHCFLFTGERVPRISFKTYYSFCRGKYMSYSGNWERIEDPSPDIMCPMCMDMVRRKTTTRFHLLPWKRARIGIVVGLLFIASSLVPVGVYHHEGEANITGVLWNFMIPTGWFYMLVGAVLIFHKRLGLENKRLAFVMFVAGLLFYPLLLRQNVDYWLGLWRGVTGDYDVESIGFLKLMLYFPFCVALTSMVASLLVITLRATETKESAEGLK